MCIQSLYHHLYKHYYIPPEYKKCVGTETAPGAEKNSGGSIHISNTEIVLFTFNLLLMG